MDGLTMIGILLLIVGFILVGVEMVVPGFGAPGIIGGTCLLGGIFCTADGYIYFTDSTHALRVLVPGVGGDHTKGVVKPVAGVTGAAGNIQIGDASSPLGKLHTPEEIEIDANGVIYIAENGNSAIRVLTPVN